MNCHKLTDDEAERIAEAYFLCDRDRYKMAEMLGHPRILDQEFLSATPVRIRIAAKAREMRERGVYSREEHIENLKKIRDLALGDENYKVGLSAEIAVGKAAGLYENIGGGEDASVALPPPAQMTSAQLRERLAQLQPQPALSSPQPDAELVSATISPKRDKINEDLF